MQLESEVSKFRSKIIEDGISLNMLIVVDVALNRYDK